MQAPQKNLILRAEIIQAVRSFFIARRYLEVETPVRVMSPIPELQIDPVESGDSVLQTSPELYMKIMLASGYKRIFQICRCFRKHERGKRHLPEFTMIEWYCAESNYFDMMKSCEDLLSYVAESTSFGDTLFYQGEKIDLKKPWDRVTVADAFKAYASISIEDALSQDVFDEIISSEIEPHLGRGKPLFLYDYPVCSGALARLKPTDNRVAERFELYISGIELCNAFSELIDPVELKRRFKKEQESRLSSGKKIYPVPEELIESLKNMPEASGNALGIDRLVMIFTDSACIDDVVAFTRG